MKDLKQKLKERDEQIIKEKIQTYGNKEIVKEAHRQLDRKRLDKFQSKQQKPKRT